MSRRNKKNNYFDMFVENITYARRSIDYVIKVVEDFSGDPEILRQQMDELHTIEHAADVKKHELMEKLAQEFVTPIEREDIIYIAKSIDDITDSIEDTLQKLYVYCISEMRDEAVTFLEIMGECVDMLSEIFKEFHNFKHSKNIHDKIIELNRLEEQGDVLFIKATRRLFEEQGDGSTRLAWSNIFEQMEACCDHCEFAGNLIEEVIMKNL